MRDDAITAGPEHARSGTASPAHAAGDRAAVFFDVGDTLVHRPLVGPGRRIADTLGLDGGAARTITRIVFTEAFESPAALAARLRAEFAVDAANDATIAAIWHAQEQEPVEVDGATSCVSAARAAGAHVGIVSNIWPPYLAGFRRACPAIVPLVDAWHVSFKVGRAKPDRRLFEMALEEAGVPAARALMIGDSIDKDVRPALALGMAAIWVSPEDTSQGAGEDPNLAGCHVVRGLAEAERVIVATLRTWAGETRRAAAP